MALSRARLVHCTSERRWALARDLDQVSLRELQQVGPFVLPPGSVLREDAEHADAVLAGVVSRAEQSLDEVLGVTLAELFERSRRQ